MNIVLKKLNLINFKGIKNLEIDFDSEITNIFGDNATGKTTVFDAFTWLFFGKESGDRKDFNIKNTVDLALNRQEHEVNAVVLINDAETVIRRIYKENWVKKSGKSTAEFSGHQTNYFWDGVPFNAGDFSKKVADMLEESIFKLISNPLYFNNLKWQDRRAVLSNIAGAISDTDIAAGNSAYEALLKNLTNGKTMEHYKSQIASSKKLIKTELESIPTRIDEINRNMPEVFDVDVINKSIAFHQEEIAKLDNSMADRSQDYKKYSDAKLEHQEKIHAVKTSISTLKNEISQQVSNASNVRQNERKTITMQLDSKTSELQHIERQRDRKTDEANALEVKLEGLRSDVRTEQAKEIVFDEHAFSCPTCRRAYNTDDVEEMKSKMVENFNTDKANKIETIKTNGKKLAEDLKRLTDISYEAEISALQADINVLNAKLQEFDSERPVNIKGVDELLAENTDYAKLAADLKDLEELMPEVPELNLSDLKEKKATITSEIDKLKSKIADQDNIVKYKKRIAELEAEEKKLSGDLANLEGEEFTIAAFNKDRIETIEARINSKFKLVKFKMFDMQINGGETETCETMLDGVPFSDLNNAARINAGLDIINALCEYYGVHAPCFIDNAESITHLINVQSQIIRLVVSEPDKKLRVA